MNEKQNLHTHSLFCDGKNSLEEMVKEAITQDFTSIGFSSHAYTAFPFDECGIKSKEKEKLYLDTLSSLKEKYRGIIKIYRGIELESRDAFSLSPLPDEKPILPKDDIDWFTYHMRAMVEELGEVTKADKRWKTHRNENFNQAEKVDELADVFITAMKLAIYSGLSGQDVYNAIDRKIVENIKRLEMEKR